METSPLIGVTTRRMSASHWPSLPVGLKDLWIDSVMSDYARALADAGAVPVLLPRSADAKSLVERIDGLVLSGGEDVSPNLYGQESDPTTGPCDLERDEFEVGLIEAALSHSVPILAICRGVQILNVALGGTLLQDLPVDDVSHADTDLPPDVRRHGIHVVSGSSLSEALQLGSEDDVYSVNSFHHQALSRVAREMKIVARATDGTIEGVEIPNRDVIGVQWHPELLSGSNELFAWLVRVSTEFKRKRKLAV